MKYETSCHHRGFSFDVYWPFLPKPAEGFHLVRDITAFRQPPTPRGTLRPEKTRSVLKGFGA